MRAADVVHPRPGSPEELQRFAQLQDRLPAQFRDVFAMPVVPRSVVVVPSLSMDKYVMSKIEGAPHYEERLLCLLMLLRLPRTRVIYLTSEPVHPTIVDYYLHLLPGIPVSHARKRLVLLSCHDNSSRTLTEKLLDRPRLLARIRDQVPDPHSAHIACFSAKAGERTLAVRLGLPLYACDPALAHLGDKSHGRKIMREAGVPVPPGLEHLRDAHDLGTALAELKRRNPALRRAVVKLNEGFSGEGNAVLDYDGCPGGAAVEAWVRDELPTRLRYEAAAESWESYLDKFVEMGGIAEAYIEGARNYSPNVRTRITPTGEVEAISTQDQVLGGPSGQVYLACRFPAHAGYRVDVQNMAHRICGVLRDRGVLGQVGTDFICTPRGKTWDIHGIEVNIRRGGATHPFLMLRYLTDGVYDADTATYHTPAGEQRCFYASDNVEKTLYRGLTPDDLVDIAVENGLHFNGATQKGLVFHLIGALSRFGKLGIVCIEDTLERAEQRYHETLAVLDREAAP